MEIIKMTPEMMDAMMTDLDAAIAPVGQKYGFKLSCGWDTITNGGLGATFAVNAEALFPADYTPAKIAFAEFLVRNRYDERYELTADCFGEKFMFDGKEIQVVGSYGNFNDKNITVRVDGELYQMPPLFIRDGLNGEATSDLWMQEWKVAQKAAKNLSMSVFPVVTGRANSGIKIWQWAVNSLPCFKFENGDYEKTVYLYGKPYIICGFYAHKPFRYVVLTDTETRSVYYKVPAYKVQNALGRLL